MYTANTSHMLLLAFYKFIGGKSCFKFLRARLPKGSSDKLDRLVGIRCKITRASVDITFLNNCIKSETYPRRFFKSIRRTRTRPTSTELRKLAETELSSSITEKNEFQIAHSQLLHIVDDLNLVCRIKFLKHCRMLIETSQN